MPNYFLDGFLLGIAYIAPIGIQNMYVINTAASSSKLRAYQVALITIFFDITLTLACFFGIGVVLSTFPILRILVLFIGSFAVLYIGVNLIRSNQMSDISIKVDQPLIKAAAMCFTVTWINPQAIIDGTLLLGSFKASLPVDFANIFISGTVTASLFWFLLITTIVSTLKNTISGKVLQALNVLCGSIIIFYGIKLGCDLIALLT